MLCGDVVWRWCWWKRGGLVEKWRKSVEVKAGNIIKR